jgi:hypothetical protein
MEAETGPADNDKSADEDPTRAASATEGCPHEPGFVGEQFNSRFAHVMASTDRVGKVARQRVSGFLVGFGAVLMLLAVLTRIKSDTYRLADVRCGEFLAILFCGLLIVLVGTGYRIYSGWVNERAQRETEKWIRERAAIEADAENARAASLAESCEKSPPSGINR